MNKGVIRIQKGLLMIEALVKSKDLTPKQKLEDIFEKRINFSKK